MTTNLISSTRLEGAASAEAACSSTQLHPARLKSRNSSQKKFHLYVKVDAAIIMPNTLKKWADYANYIQHRILVGRMYWQAKEGGFVSLHRRTLERAIHYPILREVLHWMIENKVIERDGNRSDGTGYKPAQRKDGSDGISIGYRFCKNYDRLPMQRVACRSVKANNKFLRLQNPPKRMANYTKVHKHLRGWLQQVSIDLTAALELVADAKLDPTIAEQVINLSGYIANGDATDLTVCNYGRVHTAHTRLLALIRGCLSIKGQPLVELDVANSQPLFLGITILQTIANNRIKTLPDILRAPQSGLSPEGLPNLRGSYYRGLAYKGDDIINNDQMKSSIYSNSSKTPFLHPSLPSFLTPLLYDPRKSSESAITDSNSNGLWLNKCLQPFIPTDLRIFIQLCMMGTLYEYLIRQMDWTGGRGGFKDEFFHMLYGPLTDSPMTQVMQRDFPSVMAFMVWHKGRHGYKQLSREMQRAESQLMIEGVCGSLMEKTPQIPQVTIHDSIMTTGEFIPIVSATIQAEFRKLGIRPTIKIKQPAGGGMSVPSLIEHTGGFNLWEIAA